MLEWLGKLQARPKDGEPLASMAESKADEALAKLAAEIEQMMSNDMTRVWVRGLEFMGFGKFSA